MKASCSNCTISCPIAFLAAKPFVQVRSTPESSADCSTGKENVRPRCTTSAGPSSEGEASEAGMPGVPVRAGGAEAESVRKASTESAR